MGDASLRALEHGWRASGAPEDEAAYLQARARAGDLDADRLLLAARLGHPAARLALGVSAPAPTLILREWDHPVEFNELFTLVQDVALHGCEPLLRLSLALARHVLPHFEAVCPRDSRPRDALTASETWLSGVGSVTAEDLRDTGWAAGSAGDEVVFEDFPANQAAQVAQRTTDAASNMLREDLLGARGTVEFAALQAFRAVGQDGAETLRAAAVAELLAWALA